MTTQTIEMPEVTLYFAHSPEPEYYTEEGRPVHDQYIFDSLDEAKTSGMIYEVITFEELQADIKGGYTFKDVIVNTQQGKFTFFSETEYDWMTEQDIEINCGYRPAGASEHFSKSVEYHLQWNKGSKLLSVKEVNSKHQATIRNANGDIVVIH